MSDSLQPHGLRHASLPCPSPTPGACSNSCPSSQWCHLILCCPLLLLPPMPPSIRVFSNESALHMRWPKYWSFSFSISPSNEHPGLISFRMDWVDLLAVQGTLKSLLQHHTQFNSSSLIIGSTEFYWASIICAATMETIIEIPQKIKNITTIGSRNATSGCISKGNKIIILKICLHLDVHCSSIYNS